MALKKAVETATGVAADYHRIGSLEIHPKRSLVIFVELYKDNDARIKNKAPITRQRYELSGAKFLTVVNTLSGGDGVFDELATACYGYLKTLSEFKNAINI